MKEIFTIAYKQAYLNGYSKGLNPRQQFERIVSNEAFAIGFNSGRSDYERMNGSISNGIPHRIVTDEILEDYLLAGLLGLTVEMSGYTYFQIDLIEQWYQSGIEKYNPDQNNCLFEILEKNGILLS
ncbi:hypothetical protein [Flavobacterium xinjiangense]|uniref:Uncharacterized protein n=1 Tax=Flavobacterium xinjiangense TaxID=178356 RepID=A0A1M7P0M8_9FLAO|nr:hypothetical protein [Flavobacterium xinjiangense]SHN09926.1 hypothetical protein SAMN05216269_11312 [Flavobacterium xinjiangense]